MLSHTVGRHLEEALEHNGECWADIEFITGTMSDLQQKIMYLPLSTYELPAGIYAWTQNFVYWASPYIDRLPERDRWKTSGADVLVFPRHPQSAHGHFVRHPQHDTRNGPVGRE
jgi:hypothetical protein